MVLDTRWKRFKYSNGNKALCVLLALIMVAVFVMNGFSLIRCLYFFHEDGLDNPKSRSFYSSYLFSISLNRDIATIAEQVNRNAELKAYYEAEAAYVEKAMVLYRAEEEKNRLTAEELSDYIDRLHSNEDIYNTSVGDYYWDYDGYYDDEYYLSYYYNIYDGEDGNWYNADFDFESLKTAIDISNENLDFGHTDERARELLKLHFSGRNYYSYISDNYYDRNVANLENISFYGENSDGTVFTNVEDGKALVSSIEKGEGNYIVFENGELRLSAGLEELQDILWERDMPNSRIYISLNTDFTGKDQYGVMFSEYKEIADTGIVPTVTAMAISLLAFIAFAVMSVRLAGHTESGISMALIDKFPHDLHFAIMGVLVFFAGAGITAFIIYYGDFLELGYSWGVVSSFLSSKLFSAAIIALACAIYLLILEFATSVARSVKAERPIIKKSLIGMLFRNGGKGLIIVMKFIFVTVIGGFFRLIGKVFRIILHFIKTIALKPKRLEKKLVRATVLYTLFNFVSFAIIADLFVNAFVYGIGGGLLGLFMLMTLVALDVYAVYRATKYLKALDDIIDSSAKREPLPYETDALPQSLKTLAESLEATNAELNEAVLKAVKDERTKAELITNVSHDLKTPLTSVINYIDLLQKCEIEDETAKQYMAVIEEKSARLKRLIEDLIEASKVSTGNVTLNKTKLNLCELASQAIVEESSDIEKNNLQIIFEETPNKHIVFADGTKIYRVFENLLSNARKYSAPYSRIYASVYSDDNSGYFEIKNISKDPLNISAEELTERFVRGDKSRSEEGNGLGLSIARELCKLNGGDLIITIDGDLFKATVKLPKEEN